MLPTPLPRGVDAVADEAANLIGEFDEGFSNRQTWHNAALAAIAVWFEDEELAGRAVEGPTGILAHLLRGFGDDGMWYEGENYHLFALRGSSSRWAGPARPASICWPTAPRRPGSARRSGRPRSPRCPTSPFPPARIRGSACRWPSRCTWSSGRSASRGWATTISTLWGWLRELYRLARATGRSASTPTCTRPASRRAPARQLGPLLVGAAGDGSGAAGSGRARGSRGTRCSRARDSPSSAAATATPAWNAARTAAGTAIRTACISRCTRTVCIGCPIPGPARTWPATSSGIAPPWRTTRRDSTAPPSRRRCGAAPPSASRETGPGRAAVRASSRAPWWPARRTSSTWSSFRAGSAHVVELPWHPTGQWSPSRRADGAGADSGPTSSSADVERSRARALPARCAFAPTAADGERLGAPPDVRRRAPPCAGAGTARHGGPGCRSTCCAREARECGSSRCRGIGVRTAGVRGWRVSGDLIEVETGRRRGPARRTSDGWDVIVEDDHGHEASRGAPATGPEDLAAAGRPRPPHADGRRGPRRDGSSALDGRLDGFDFSEPLELDHEDQYRRSEEPYPGPRSSPPPPRCTGTSTASMSAWTSGSPSSGSGTPRRRRSDWTTSRTTSTRRRPDLRASRRRPAGLRLPRAAFGRGRQHSRAPAPRAPRAIRPWCAAGGSPLIRAIADGGVALPEWEPEAGRTRSVSTSWSIGSRRAASAGRGSWCGAAAGDGSTSVATARTPRRSACWSCAEHGSRRRHHVDRQQASRRRSSGPRASRLPLRMTRSSGCRVWDDEGREYVDFLMALGAVALGYGHPAVTRARSPRQRSKASSDRCRRCWRKRWLPSSVARSRGSSGFAFSRPAPRPWRPPCDWRGSSPDATSCWAAATTGGSTGARPRRGGGCRRPRAPCTGRSRSTTPPGPASGSAPRATASPPWCSSP